MEYTSEIDIDRPRDEVVAIFDDPDNLPRWQKGLQSFEHLTGEPGRPGATSRLVFQEGRRRIEMVETITERDLPDRFSGTYDAKGVHNIVDNTFTEPAPGRTRWTMRNVFEFRGVMKVASLLFRRSIPGTTRAQMEAFKAFAEHGTQVGS
jgi:uncharacterized membrane protein